MKKDERTKPISHRNGIAKSGEKKGNSKRL